MDNDEISGVIVSRTILEEYGYNADNLTREQLQTIADNLIDYWSVSDGYEDALRSVMSNFNNTKNE